MLLGYENFDIYFWMSQGIDYSLKGGNVQKCFIKSMEIKSNATVSSARTLLVHSI